MRIRWGARVLGTLALLSVLCGCEQSFLLAHFAEPSEDCALVAEGASALERGVLDLAFRDGYTATAVLKNIVANPVADGPASVRVEGTNVRIWPGGRKEGEPIYQFSAPATGYVSEGETRPLPLLLLPRQAVDALVQARFDGRVLADLWLEDLIGYRELVTVGVSVLGTTFGGSAVETPEAFLSIDLCGGCLVECTEESRGDASASFDYCTSFEPVEDEPCRLGQDQLIDCRLGLPFYGEEVSRMLCERS